MGKKFVLCLVAALTGMVFVPAVAQAALVNEYGMHFAGQDTCLQCHDPAQAATVHGRFAKQGLVPDAPEGWDIFKAAGDVGSSYSIAGNTWVTLGDYLGGAATEYLFWKGSSDPLVNPWGLVEGLVAEPPHGEWMVGEGGEGLYDVTYGCQRCHMLGSTWPKANESDTNTVPNPAATIAPTTTTAKQWARSSDKTVADFMSDPTVSYLGLGIQCEQCHGTGVEPRRSDGAPMAFNHSTQVSMAMGVLGKSQVCGQCHGSYTNVAGTLGIYGYTANLPLRDFVDINGVSGGQSYTYIPTEEEFLATPTAYFMFPNGSNAKGSHYYYNEWAASAHSYRGAYYTTDVATIDPDAMAFQASGHGHYNATTESSITSKCYQCHTGEGYLSSKDAKIAEDFEPTASNTGFMGQECVTCHTPHPAAVGDEGNIREPDAAGERSAAGLTVGNSSVCEDCHNWQFEVQGTSASYRPQASLTGRGGPSHPQRETLHGRVMVDIPAAAEFMPGVKCEDCHMPKTNRNANRFSHGMKIMLPGDADLWMGAAGANYRGEDSCSTCHPAQTRSELQAFIDGWQGDASAAAAAAGAAIDAAYARTPEADRTNAASASYKLIGRATWNYKAYGNDLSGGVHNPEYVVAGLEKAEQMAKSAGGSFAQFFKSASVVPGGTGFLTGKVVNGDGTPAAGAMLALYAGGMATGETTVSAANGTFSFMIAPAGTTTYKVHWVRSGDAATQLASADMTVKVAKLSSKTTVKASVKTMRLGNRVKLTGKVTPMAAGQKVKLQYRKGTASWKSWSLTLNASSAYSKSFKPGSRGTWSFRTQYAGTATVASSKSGTIKVTVR
jgi:formate-dependent nitrite reductase cytochrome c552 subunit